MGAFLFGESTMPKIQRISIITIFLFLFSTFAQAQAQMSYVFLEVVDSQQKPVESAKIEHPLPYKTETGIKETDQKGLARFEWWEPGPGLRLSEFTIQKPDYYPFELFGLLRGIFYENWRDSYRQNLKIELLKIPRNKDEKKSLGDEQIKRDFFSAVLNGNAAEVRRMLKSGINPNISTDDLRGVPAPKEIPAMLYAADNADIAVMNEFLSAKINLRNENSNIRNLLAYYIGNLNNHVKTKEQFPVFNEYVETLLKAGASLKATDAKKQPLLMIAAQQNNVELVKKLIEKGVDVNAKTEYGSTALTDFIYRNAYSNTDDLQIEIIKTLLEAGANPNVFHDGYDGDCNFPLKILAQQARLELIKLLLSHGADATLKCKNGDNALSSSSGAKYLEQSNILIDAGADVNAAENNWGTTPLMIAVGFRDFPLIKKLLAKGANINTQANNGSSPLIFAIATGEKKPDIQLVEFLLKSGANPNLTLKQSGELKGATALSLAIWYEPRYSTDKYQYASDEILKLLIAYKADVNLTVQYKDSPLVSAVKGGRVEAVKILIEAGADVKGEEGHKALAIAQVNMKFDKDKNTPEQIIKLLTEAGAK